MAMTPCQVIIRGIRDNPAITEVNVRSGPNTGYALLFKISVGTSGLPVLDARADDKNAAFEGKVYQWIKVAFPNGQDGWVRDDLVDILGDGTRYGYGILNSATPAFALARSMKVGVIAPGQEIFAPGVQPSVPAPAPAAPPTAPPATAAPAPAPAGPPATKPAAPAPVPSAPMPAAISGDSRDRIRKAAFNITGAFEGGGYATYQTYDAGIVSYGRFQFTLAAGSFVTVINRYIERSTTSTAAEFRNYLPRFSAKDEGLRQDGRLKELCIQAAQEQVMRDVQDEIAVEGFFQPVVELSIDPRGIVMPLSQALIFDMAINHGRFNHLLPKTEEVLGVPNKSRVGANGVTEQQFVTKLAELRQQNLYALADKHNLPGLKKRGDFWVNLARAGDWNLQGDADGNVNINGKIVQVRTP